MAAVRSVTCGYEHTAVIAQDGSLWTAGRNKNGVCALGTSTLRECAFRRVRPPEHALPPGWGVAFTHVECGHGGSGGHMGAMYKVQRMA